MHKTNFIKLLLYLAWFNFYPALGYWNPQGVQGRFQQMNLVKEGPFLYQCHKDTPASKTCPYVFTQFEKDKQDGLIASLFNDSPGRAPFDLCDNSVNVSDRQHLSSQELEQRLAENDETSLGLSSDFFVSKGEECYQNSLYDKSEDEVEHEKKIILSMGYHYLNRTKRGTSELMQYLASVNSLLGENVVAGISCDAFVMPSEFKLCQQLQGGSCQPKGGLETAASDLMENFVEPLLALKLKEEEVRKKGSPLGRSRKSTALKKVLDAIEVLENSNPILSGNKMESFLEREVYSKKKLPTQAALMGALKEQLVQDKKAALERLDENHELNRCLIYGDSNDCENFEEILAKTPTINSVYNYSNQNYRQRLKESKDPRVERSKAKVESLYYSVPQCYDSMREIKTGVDELTIETGLGIGLTIATFGTGALVAGGRASVIASGSILAADTAYFATGMKEAIKTCQQSLGSLGSLAGGTQSYSGQKFQCPKGVASPAYHAKDDVAGCVSAVVLAGIDGLPFVPAVVKKFAEKGQKVKEVAQTDTRTYRERVIENSQLGEKDRLDKASEIFEGPLSQEQAQAIIKAHESGEGSVFHYTEAQLRKKMKILVAGGFSRAEAGLLIREGIVGRPPTKLASGAGKYTFPSQPFSSMNDIHIRPPREITPDAEYIYRGDSYFFENMGDIREFLDKGIVKNDPSLKGKNQPVGVLQIDKANRSLKEGKTGIWELILDNHIQARNSPVISATTDPRVALGFSSKETAQGMRVLIKMRVDDKMVDLAKFTETYPNAAKHVFGSGSNAEKEVYLPMGIDPDNIDGVFVFPRDGNSSRPMYGLTKRDGHVICVPKSTPCPDGF